MRHSPNEDGRPRSLLLRLAVTLLAPALVLAGERISLPGVDVAVFTDRLPPEGSWFDPANTSVLALGVMPFVNACLLVELVALVVPRWSALRHGGPAGRAKLARASAVLGIVLAAFQGWGIGQMLTSTELLTSAGLLPQLLVTATLIAGTCCLLLLAQLVDRLGLVGGLALLTAVPPAIGAVHQTAHLLFQPEPAPTRVLAATIGGAVLAVAATVAVFRLSRPASANKAGDAGERTYRESAEAQPSASERIPVPASGIFPLSIAASLLMLPATLANLGLPLDGVTATLNRGDTLFLTLYVALIAASAVGLSYLFNWPARVATLWSHVGGGRRTQDEIEASVRTRMRGAVVRTVAFLLGLVVIGELTGRFGGVRIAPMVIALATALVLDAAREWRERRRTPDLVPIWPEHRPYGIDVARAALAEAGIAVHARGEHQRALLQFYGPYVPIELYVSSKDAERATDVLSEALLARAADAPAPAGKTSKKRTRKAQPGAPIPAWAQVLGAVALLTGGALVSMRAGPLAIAPTEEEPPLEGVAAASLEMVAVDDRANPFGRTYTDGSDPEDPGRLQTKLDLPDGASLSWENVPDGPGHTLPRPYVRMVVVGNESMDAARERLSQWLRTVPLPPGSRFALERYSELDEQDKRVPIGWRTIVLGGNAVVTTSDVADATARLPRRGDPLDSAAVAITLTPEGGERFRSFTRQNIKRRMAIVIDGIVESAPVIQTEISGGQVQVTMGAGDPQQQIADARRLAGALRGGRSPSR